MDSIGEEMFAVFWQKFCMLALLTGILKDSPKSKLIAP
jgi:hypothetical protein